ncbi:MAG: hypothetical protein LBT60_06130 [Oscillospiraceae bacterium]|jgi:hypothetical protein|nr:hypothetical protein [Oscillospiraceae bacterium]
MKKRLTALIAALALVAALTGCGLFSPHETKGPPPPETSPGRFEDMFFTQTLWASSLKQSKDTSYIRFRDAARIFEEPFDATRSTVLAFYDQAAGFFLRASTPFLPEQLAWDGDDRFSLNSTSYNANTGSSSERNLDFTRVREDVLSQGARDVLAWTESEYGFVLNFQSGENPLWGIWHFDGTWKSADSPEITGMESGTRMFCRNGLCIDYYEGGDSDESEPRALYLNLNIYVYDEANAQMMSGGYGTSGWQMPSSPGNSFDVTESNTIGFPYGHSPELSYVNSWELHLKATDPDLVPADAVTEIWCVVH